jgi:phospholipase C
MKKAHKAIAGIIFLGAALTLVDASCDPPTNWGLEAINTMPTPQDPAGLSCGVTLPADTLAASRTGCAFGPGAKAEQTLGITPEVASQIPIRHIIVVMKENRSFDHLLGKLHDLGVDTDAIPPDFSNPDTQGNVVPMTHATSTCIHTDPQHQATAMTDAVDGGKMDGYVKNGANGTGSDGHFTMTYYDQGDLPFNYWLAKSYALSDRHFAPLQSGTYANRDFMMFGRNAGVVDTGISYPPPETNSIFRLLMNAGYTWGAYTDSEPFSGSLNWTSADPGVHSMADFYTAAANGTLPNVAFVDAMEDTEDDHPLADLQVGEAWTKKVYDAVVASPEWPLTAMIWTYDEGGAFADHVPPPNGCLTHGTGDWPYPAFGVRVPLVAISPWAKRGYVSHVPHDHTAITRFIETVFNLPALTERDANSDALLDLFDFSCGHCKEAAPPKPAPDEPASGSGGCNGSM